MIGGCDIVISVPWREEFMAVIADYFGKRGCDRIELADPCASVSREFFLGHEQGSFVHVLGRTRDVTIVVDDRSWDVDDLRTNLDALLRREHHMNTDWASGFDAARRRAVSVLDASMRAMLRDSTAPFDARVVEAFKSAREWIKALDAESVAADDPEARVRGQLLDGLADRLGRALEDYFVRREQPDADEARELLRYVLGVEDVARAMESICKWSGPRPAIPPEIDPADVDSDDEWRFVRGARAWLDATYKTPILRAIRERILVWQREHASRTLDAPSPSPVDCQR